jgi:hypothetical protein
MILSLKEGIPESLRGKIWMTLSKSLEIALNHSEDVYYKLLRTEDKEIESLINRDLERTMLSSVVQNPKTKKPIISQVDLSSKQQKLFNILKAYAIYDSEVGYCQGTNYIVAVLLNNINSERASFWAFVQIMNDKNWRDLYINNTPKLMRMLDVLKNMIMTKIPDLYNYFEESNVN